MSDVVTINGKEYKIGDIVKSEYYHKDEFNNLVLNGFTVKVGDTWLTRNKEKVKITALNSSAWPIVGSNYSATYSVLGIRNADYSISDDDLETKFVEDECAEPIPSECTDMGLPAESNVKESDASSYDIIDTANCECNFDYEFENTLKRLVTILSDKIKERALHRDLAAVKDLTKKLEKVIALEDL